MYTHAYLVNILKLLSFLLQKKMRDGIINERAHIIDFFILFQISFS
jgi:hypothetical protein